MDDKLQRKMDFHFLDWF